MGERNTVRITVDLPEVLEWLMPVARAGPWAAGWGRKWKQGRSKDWKRDWGAWESRGHRERGDERFREERQLELPVTADGVAIRSRNGGIRVAGWDRDEIQVLAEVEAWGHSESEARSLADEIEIETDGRIVARGPEGDDDLWSVSYRVRVPHETRLDLETSNGALSIADVAGEIRFAALNGGVSLAGLGGDVRGRTQNGRLTAELTGERWEGSGLDVETSNGGVTLRIPEGYSAELETSTVNGRTVVDFPLQAEVEGRVGRRLRATLGDGGAPIRAVTTNGRIRIQRP